MSQELSVITEATEVVVEQLRACTSDDAAFQHAVYVSATTILADKVLPYQEKVAALTVFALHMKDEDLCKLNLTLAVRKERGY